MNCCTQKLQNLELCKRLQNYDVILYVWGGIAVVALYKRATVSKLLLIFIIKSDVSDSLVLKIRANRSQ